MSTTTSYCGWTIPTREDIISASSMNSLISEISTSLAEKSLAFISTPSFSANNLIKADTTNYSGIKQIYNNLPNEIKNLITENDYFDTDKIYNGNLIKTFNFFDELDRAIGTYVPYNPPTPQLGYNLTLTSNCEFELFLNNVSRGTSEFLYVDEFNDFRDCYTFENITSIPANSIKLKTFSLNGQKAVDKFYSVVFIPYHWEYSVEEVFENNVYWFSWVFSCNNAITLENDTVLETIWINTAPGTQPDEIHWFDGGY